MNNLQIITDLFHPFYPGIHKTKKKKHILNMYNILNYSVSGV